MTARVPVPLVLAVVESTLTIEMAKQLVGAIYQVDNHEELAVVMAGIRQLHQLSAPKPLPGQRDGEASTADLHSSPAIIHLGSRLTPS